MNERLHPWWRTMPPHRDIAQHKRLDASIFAADLAQVVRGNAPDDYQDPARFFATTYLSDGLRDLTTRVLRELAGVGADNRIVQIDTPFGGGKTHTLLTLYHLLHTPEVVRGRPELAALVAEAGPPAVPDAEVATIIGTEGSAAEVVEYDDGVRAHTLWGQIAHGLGGRAAYDLLREADERRVAPGVSTLLKILAPRPALILIDELVNYIVGAAGIAVGDSTLKDQTISFLQQLTAAVAQTPKSVLLLTIPASQTELYGAAADSLRQQTLFTAARQIGDIAGRVLTVTTPVQGDDIYEVLRRRLFEQPTSDRDRRDREAEARRVAQAYVRMYRAIPHDVPLAVQDEAYIERIVRSYPFHPDLVLLLYERWGTLPNFQRTRGALRILGLVLADLLQRNLADPLILPAHVNLGPGELRNDLVRVVGEPRFASVLDSDIAGANAKATEVDRGLGSGNARFKPAERVATTAFLWSFSGASGGTRGATEANLRVGALEPDMQSAIVGNVLSEFRRKLWYLHEEGDTYRFDTQANLNLVIVQKEQSVSAAAARDAVEKAIRTLADVTNKGPHVPRDTRVSIFPTQPGDIADSATLGIVLLCPDMAAPVSNNLDALPPLVERIFHWGGNDRPRGHQNALAVLVPDPAQVSAADGAAKRVLALRAAASDTQLALPERQRNELETMRREAERVFPQVCGSVYRSVVVPAGRDRGGMERFDLGIQTLALDATLWDAAFAELAANERFLTALGPMPLLSERFGLWRQGQEYVSTQTLWDAFTQFPHLPMLAGKPVLVAAIERGANEGMFGYAVGDEVGPPFATGRFGNHNTQLTIDIAPTSFLVSKEYAQSHFQPKTEATEPVREIDPRLLQDPAIWPQGNARVTLPDVWERVQAHYAPRPIAGKHVFTAAVIQGIADGVFRATDGTDAPVDAERLTTYAGVQLTPPERIPPKPKHILTIDIAGVNGNKLLPVVQGVNNAVVRPANARGASVTLRLVVDVNDPGGIDQTWLDLTVKTAFEQLGLTPDYTTE